MTLATVLTWVTLGPIIILAAVVCVAFAAIPIADRRERRVLSWEPGGPVLPRTLPHLPAPRWADPDPAETRPLPLHLMYAALAVREQLEETDRIKRRIHAATPQKRQKEER